MGSNPNAMHQLPLQTFAVAIASLLAVVVRDCRLRPDQLM
jgi:hypothetical protein